MNYLFIWTELNSQQKPLSTKMVDWYSGLLGCKGKEKELAVHCTFPCIHINKLIAYSCSAVLYNGLTVFFQKISIFCPWKFFFCPNPLTHSSLNSFIMLFLKSFGFWDLRPSQISIVLTCGQDMGILRTWTLLGSKNNIDVCFFHYGSHTVKFNYSTVDSQFRTSSSVVPQKMGEGGVVNNCFLQIA